MMIGSGRYVWRFAEVCKLLRLGRARLCFHIEVSELFDWLRRVLNRSKKEEALAKAPIVAIVEVKREVQHPSLENVANTANVAHTSMSKQPERHVEGPLERPLQRTLQQELIAKRNLQHRTRFSNAEHFKQRQPTTARKLWHPDAKLEED